MEDMGNVSFRISLAIIYWPRAEQMAEMLPVFALCLYPSAVSFTKALCHQWSRSFVLNPEDWYGNESDLGPGVPLGDGASDNSDTVPFNYPYVSNKSR